MIMIFQWEWLLVHNIQVKLDVYVEQCQPSCFRFDVRKLDGNATMLYAHCNPSVIDKVWSHSNTNENAKLKHYFVVEINGLWQHNYMVC